MPERTVDTNRPRSAVKVLEEASSTPRVALLGPSRGLKHGNHGSFLPLVASPVLGGQKKEKKSDTRVHDDKAHYHLHMKQSSSSKAMASAFPAIASNPNTPGNIRWLEDEVGENISPRILKPRSKRADQWPPDVSTSNYAEMILAVPKTNGKLKIQVRRLRDGGPSQVGDSGHKSSSAFGLFVHAFRLPSRAEGIINLGDEVISAFGVSLVGESPKLLARLLDENHIGEFVQLTIRRRDFGGFFDPNQYDNTSSEALLDALVLAEPEPIASRSNNQISPDVMLVDTAVAVVAPPMCPIPEIPITEAPPSPVDQTPAVDEAQSVGEVNASFDEVHSVAVPSTDAAPPLEPMTPHDTEPGPEKITTEIMDLTVSKNSNPSELIPAEEVLDRSVVVLSDQLAQSSVATDGTVESEGESALELPKSPIVAQHVSYIRKPSEMISIGGLNEDSVDSVDQDSPVLTDIRSNNSTSKLLSNSESVDNTLRQKSKSDMPASSFMSTTVVTVNSPKITRPKTANTNFPSKSRAMSDDIPTPIMHPYPDYYTPQVQKRKSAVNVSLSTNKKKYQSRPHSSGSSTYGRNTAAAGLTLLHNLSKEYTRAEARAEGQCLSIALRQISHSGQTIVELAARKIQCWAKLTIPRKQFLRRMENRGFVRTLLFQIGDKACIVGEKRVKRRQNLLRMAAAICIQRVFRTWRRDYLSNVLRIQKAWRRAIIRAKIRRLVTTVRSCVRIYRYIQRKIKKYSKLSRNKRMKLLCKIMKRFFDYRGFELRRQQQVEFLLRYQHSNNAPHIGSMMLQGRRRHIETSKRENAILKIQRLWRGFKARLRCFEIRRVRRAMQAFRSAVMVFLIRLKARRRMKELNAAIKLQKRFRGMKERTKMYRRIVAGIKITQAWFKYRQYKKLKEYCRRIIRPLRITLANMENIPSQTIFSGNLKIKVSLWWSPLLHLMGAKDYGTVVNSKRPQFVYKTQLRPVVLMAPKQNINKDVGGKKVRTFPSFYNVASLRLAVEKSVSKLDSEVYIGQSFPGEKLIKPNVPFTVIQDNVVVETIAASSLHDSDGVTNWDEVSGNGDKFENMNKDIAALPVIPRRSSLRKSNEAIPILNSSALSSLGTSAPTLEAVAAAASPAAAQSCADVDEPPPRPDYSRQSSGNSEVSGSPMFKRKVSFDATNLERVEPFKESLPTDRTQPNFNPDNAVIPASISPDETLCISNKPVQSSAAVIAKTNDNAETEAEKMKNVHDFSHLDGGVKVLQKNPELLRRLSRRVSRARIAAEYRDEDTAEELAAAAAQNFDTLGSLKKTPYNGITHANRGKQQARKASVFGKIGDDLVNLFGGEQRKALSDDEQIRRKSYDSQTHMKCSFDNELIHIPGCHGNSVIKFEVFDGDRKFGSTLFHLSAHDRLMFWGGEFEQEIELFKSRRQVNLDLNVAHGGVARAADEQLKPILKVKVEGGRPLQSDCDWCRASFKGASAGFGPFASFFDRWNRYYISLDGYNLRFCESKNSVEASTSIPMEDIDGFRVELSGFDRNAAKQSKAAFVEDGYFFIISTSSIDDVYIKFADSSIRENWEFTLGKILEKNGKGIKDSSSKESKSLPGQRSKTIMSPKKG